MDFASSVAFAVNEKLPVETTGTHVEGSDHVDSEYHNHLVHHDDYSAQYLVIDYCLDVHEG